ncbi:MAG: hypothetical protein AB7P34_05515 [Vicinamibacterales bacterium]
MKIQHLIAGAALVGVTGFGLAAYAQTKPVSARTSVAVYKSPT